MKSTRVGNYPCLCPSCLYIHNKVYRGIDRTASKIDKLYRDKYLPLRERSLIEKLERTRAVYNDIRAPYLADSESNNISNNIHRNSSELNKCRSCCRCTRKVNNISGDTDVSSYNVRASKRRVRFKPEFIKSEPCLCLVKFGSLVKKHSEFMQLKLKRNFSVPALANKFKEALLKQRTPVGKVFKRVKKVRGSKEHFDKKVQLSDKKMPKMRDMVKDIKYKNNFEGPKYLKELDPRLCHCPEEKLVLKIRKDSIRKFYEDLEKKQTLKHLECKSECIQDICIPKECLDKIQLSKAKESSKKTKKSPKQRKSLKQIVSKTNRRMKKKSVSCQCDDTIMPTIENHKHRHRRNKVKFVPSNKSTREKSYLKSNITFDRLNSKTDNENALKRCFCTLKFKPSGAQNIKQKYSLRPELDYYPYSGQSGDMKMSFTQMNKTLKKFVKSQSNCTDYDCDPNECLKDYNTKKRHKMVEEGAKLPAPNMLNAKIKPKSYQDNRRVLRVGSSISFNVEFFKESVPKDPHKSVKMNTVPLYLSHKSIKSIRAQRSSKNITKQKNKRKVVIKDKLPKTEDPNSNKNIPNNIFTKIKKFANAKNNIKPTKDITPQNTINDIDLKTEMVDQSTKITNKDKRLLNHYICKPKVCVPGKCDPYLCLETINKHKHVITNTDYPKMVSVASGIHKRKLKYVQAQSKTFQRKKSFDKSDINKFEDTEHIQSNILPKMGDKKTLRLSSNLSFAVEIGRSVFPDINPIEKIKHHGTVYKGKKINNDHNYVQRKNKSKSSVINTMVKRCMCTLNLSKQRTKNKSFSKIKDNQAQNVYTVNTLITSNFGPFLEKPTWEKKTPHVRKVYSNEYKCNISNSYAAWHSQIICNYVHLRRKLKHNVYLASKSLSFLSDNRLKKNEDWIPWHYAQSKNITLYESSDCNALSHIGKYQTLTKSSRYWKKSYCTMNLRTIYNKNERLNQLENNSHKKCGHVGSKINLSIEFYKDNLCIEQQRDMLPTKLTRKENNTTQGVILTSNEAAHFVPTNHSCFCKRKLQNKSDVKHIDKPKQKERYISRSQNTQKLKKKIAPTGLSTKKVINIKNVLPDKQFYPRECIPDICVAGQCDPTSCYEALYKQKLKTRSVSAATKTTKKIRAGVLTQQSSFKNAETQSQSKKIHKIHNKQTLKPTTVLNDNNSSVSECTKFGSNITFNIEFYKENSANRKRLNNKVNDRQITSSKYADVSSITKTQASKHQNLSARPRESLLKRCFCTLKLQKKQKKPLLTEVHSVGVMAGVKNKWYSDKAWSNQVNMDRGDATGIDSTRKQKYSITRRKDNKIKHEKQHIAMTALVPYECEPGICVPGACDPYECLKKIKDSKLITRDIGSATTRRNKKSLGTSNKNRTKSKNINIQTVSFHQNNKKKVSQVSPIEVKQKYNKSLSSNRCVCIGSNINFSIEFFKGKKEAPHETIYEDDKDVKTLSSSYKPAMNTIAVTSDGKKKRKRKKETLNITQKPIVNYEMSSKKRTLSQLSQTCQKYFSKNKGFLPYECEPNMCIPEQCDPYKCYELIQNRIYKDCSVVAVANVRDFATNAAPCYPCKSKRIQTGHEHRERSGIKYMKSVLDQKNKNYIKISSNFGFHIEICKRGRDDPLHEVKVYDDKDKNLKYKKVHDRLNDRASQSQHIKRKSQSTFAKNKLQRCFCTKKFFNSSAKTANQNFEYTTNYVLVPNIIPINNVNNTNNTRNSQDFTNTPFHLSNNKKKYEKIKNIKNKIKPKWLLKLCRNASKLVNENKKVSYLSFDLELYKREKFIKEDLSLTQNKIKSDQHIFISKQKNNIKSLKKLKPTNSKNVQGQGDSEKAVDLKGCYSTINFRNYEKERGTEQDLIYSHNDSVQQALCRKGYCIKHTILTDPSKFTTFYLPQANIIKWDEISDHLLKSKNMPVLYNACPRNKEKCSYFKSVCNKVNPYKDNIFEKFFKNMILRFRRQCDNIVESIR